MGKPGGKRQRTREQRVGRYDLVARLAIGGMGELFLAREQGIAGFERLVAIKRILPGMAASLAFREMFLREARILARLNHPNVVQTVELGEDSGNYYLVLEYLRGSTVRELLVLSTEAGHDIPAGAATGMVVQGLRGLHAAHELTDLQGNLLGTVHRDLSPHNLMCSPDGNIKLFDFGVAKATEHGEQTHSGMLKGKFAYMSPEQCRQRPLDRRSDLFSIGIVLWEMLARARLFRRGAELDTMNAITSGVVPSLAEARPDLPRELCEAVHKALALEPEDRWATAAEFEGELRRCARENGMDISVTAVARFVADVASDTLAAREKTLGAALERSLTFNERLGLIHTTGAPAKDNDHIAREVEETIQVLPISLLELEAVQPDASRAERGARIRWRRWVGAAVLLLGGVALVWLATHPAPSGPPVVMAWAPVQSPEVLRAEVAPLLSYLEAELRRPIELVVTEDYQDAADRLVDGRASFAVLPPYIYVLTKQREPRIEALATQLFDGSKSADGLLLVRDSSEFQTLSELRGASFCLVDEKSTTGALLPRAYIRSHGFDPDTFIGEVHWSRSHQQVLRDILAGKCAAGATYSGNLMTADSYGIAKGQFRRLAITGSTPQETTVAGPDVDPKLSRALQKALLEFDPREHAGAEFVGESLRITGYSLAEEKAWDSIRRGLE